MSVTMGNNTQIKNLIDPISLFFKKKPIEYTTKEGERGSTTCRYWESTIGQLKRVKNYNGTRRGLFYLKGVLNHSREFLISIEQPRYTLFFYKQR